MGKRKHAEASPAAGDATTAADPELAEKSSKKAKKSKQQQAEEQLVAVAAGASVEKKKKKKKDKQQQAEEQPAAAAAVKKEKKKDAEQQQQQPAAAAAETPSKKDKKKDKQKQQAQQQLQLPPDLPVQQLLQPSLTPAAADAPHIHIGVEVMRDPIVNEKQLIKEARRSSATAAKPAGKSTSSSSSAAGLSKAEAAAVLQRAAQLQRGFGPFVFMMGAAGLSEADEQSMGFQAYAAEADKESHPMYLTSRLPGANLIATTEMPVQSATDKAHYVVGIRNKRTGQLRLSEAAGSILLRLEAQAAHVADADVAGVIKAQQQQGQQQQGKLPEDMAARRLMARRLVEAFGSTRRKRQMKQREEGAVVVTRNADEDRLGLLLGEVAARATAAGETRAEVMGKLGAHRNIPVHNLAATQPHLAYKISAMFPDHMLAAINSGQILHAAEKQEYRQRLVDKKQVPEYVLARLQRVSDETDPRKRRRLAKLLALLAALLQLAGARNRLPLKPPRAAKEEGGAARPGGLTELSWSVGIRRVEVLEPLLDMFYNKTAEESGTVYVREDYKKQLLLMHVLVVALDVEGWSLAPAQFDALRKELKMTAADVVARFRELGCICKAAKLPTGISPDGTPSTALNSFSIALLPGGPANVKTLEQSFPKAKTGATQRGGR